MFRYLAVIFTVLIIGGSPYPSSAASLVMCGQRADVATKLKQNYEETPASMGITRNGEIVEVFTSKTGTFTIIMTKPGGLSCLLSEGGTWEELPKTLVGAKI
jgi:hypothetical protein